ncbi:MAG: KOW motif-containing protein, partial [Bacteroidota bacterium]
STIGFLSTGTDGEPTPLRPDEVNRILGRMDDALEKGEVPEMPFKSGDPIKVVDGPFNNFNGVVEEVLPDKMKVRVMVSIFGRKTPLELDYLQVEHEQ